MGLASSPVGPDHMIIALIDLMLTVDLISFPYPAEIMDPYWQNQSCDPFTARSSVCSLGNYVDFTVNVSSASDVVAGLQFAQKHNVRILIKNTGHELVAIVFFLRTPY